jgi:hypothetical protein
MHVLAAAHITGGNEPFWGIPGPVLVYQRPMDAMVDVTNDLGVAVLQVRCMHLLSTTLKYVGCLTG